MEEIFKLIRSIPHKSMVYERVESKKWHSFTFNAGNSILIDITVVEGNTNAMFSIDINGETAMIDEMDIFILVDKIKEFLEEINEEKDIL